MFVCQAVGSLLSGLLSAQFGRKQAMLIVNVPHFIAWLMLCYGSSVMEIFIGNCLLGIGNGLILSPTIAYVGEIS